MASSEGSGSLAGRVALVTGGGGHLGRAIAERLAALGCDLVVHDRREEAAAACAEETSRRYRGRAIPVAADLRDPGSSAAIVAAVREGFGRLDLLVNNAALVGDDELPGWAVPFAEQDAQTWRDCLEVNLTAPFLLARDALPLLRASQQAAIVNIVSIYGLAGPDWGLYEGTALGNPAAYAASKGGLVQLTRWLATTLAPDIRVNAVAAGGIERGQPEAFRRRYEARTPLRRMASEADVVGAVAYLAGDEAAYVTGQVLAVDGGWLAW